MTAHRGENAERGSDGASPRPIKDCWVLPSLHVCDARESFGATVRGSADLEDALVNGLDAFTLRAFSIGITS